MAGILDSVDQRTRLVGQNRLEILMFRLGGRQKFAINVFKVQEVVQLPKMTLMPHRHSSVCGVVNLRGQTLPVVDLSRAIGLRPLVPDERSTIIVTEYNRSVQAFLVGSVDRIINLNWDSIQAPPGGAGRQGDQAQLRHCIALEGVPSHADALPRLRKTAITGPDRAYNANTSNSVCGGYIAKAINAATTSNKAQNGTRSPCGPPRPPLKLV